MLVQYEKAAHSSGEATRMKLSFPPHCKVRKSEAFILEIPGDNPPDIGAKLQQNKTEQL